MHSGDCFFKSIVFEEKNSDFVWMWEQKKDGVLKCSVDVDKARWCWYRPCGAVGVRSSISMLLSSQCYFIQPKKSVKLNWIHLFPVGFFFAVFSMEDNEEWKCRVKENNRSGRCYCRHFSNFLSIVIVRVGPRHYRLADWLLLYCFDRVNYPFNISACTRPLQEILQISYLICQVLAENRH